MNQPDPQQVEMIPIDAIHMVNPRGRGRRKFQEIVDNIARLGLKKPIIVVRRNTRDGEPAYDLVCGQGRIEAFQALGQTEVPALVVDVRKEDLLLMSLAENLARRRHSAIELAKEIGALRERGYSFKEIAKKTDLTAEYVRGVCRLLKHGEERLLRAVESGQIPVNIAITISSTDDRELQRVLAEAYESKSLRGKELLRARRLIEDRRNHGKALGSRRNGKAPGSAEQLLQTYHRETNRQRYTIAKAKTCETKLLFVVNALKSMLRNREFVAILRAEKLDTLPQYLAEQLKEENAP